jgi:hypothetical protein
MNMTTRTIRAVVFTAGLAFGTVALAEGMSKAEYQAMEKSINDEHKAGMASCNSLAGKTKEICVAEAMGKAKVAKAELLARYKPSIKATHDARVAKADADYAVAKERCDEKGANDKDVCVKEAKAAKVHAVADAKAWMDTAKADAAAKKTSAEAAAKARATGTEARRDAAADKRDADYAVAREKCDVLAGDAKEACVKAAKDRFGQH